MILTTTRHGRTSRDVRNLGTHLAKQVGQTARVVKIGNCPVGNADDAYRYMVAMRDGSQATVAMHHITISPRRALTEQELDQAVGQVLSAMGAEDHAYVLHHHAEKVRAGAEVEDHYHLVLGHVGPDCRALDDRDSYARLEAVARVLETDFGEELTHSRKTRQVAERLREMGRADVADRLPQPVEAPRSAMNSTRRAAAARAGIDLPKAKVEIAAAWAAADSPAAFRSALREQGFDVAAGSKPGVFVVTHEGTEIGALDRLVREKRAAVAARMEVQQHVEPAQPARGFIAEALAAREEGRSGPSDLPGSPRSEGERGEASAAPRAPEPADERGPAAGPDRGAETAPRADPSRDAAPAARDRGPDGPDRGAARREAARQVARRAAVARLRKMDVAGLRASAAELALAPPERARRQLQDRIADARDRIRRATAPIPEPATLGKVRLQAAVAAKEATTAFERSTAAEKRVAQVRRREPRGLLAFIWRGQWKRELAAAERSHEAARSVWRQASEARTAARAALDQETRRAERDRRPIEEKNQAAERSARSDLADLELAGSLLRERPGLASLGLDRVVEIARRRLEERRDEEARRQAFAVARAAPREPAPTGPRFG